jgi:transposase InsO family protein
MVSLINAHRAEYGVESICMQLPIAPSTYYEHKAREADPERLPPRAQRDRALKPEIRRVWDENFPVYGARKVWLQLNREQIRVARCTVERLMGVLGLQGAVRDKACKTTVPDDAVERPAGPVQRQFQAERPDTSCGWRTLSTLRSGPGWSLSPSSSMSSPVVLSAGG